MARTKPQQCFDSGCPLAVTCGCGHMNDEHPEDGHCTRVTNDEICDCRGFRSKGKGFVLGVGDPTTAPLAIILEAPGNEEIDFPLDGPGAHGIIPPDELERRLKVYPQFEPRFRRVGAPVVGKSGSILNQWILPKAGLVREEIFIDNTLRCLPPKAKGGAPYPTGPERIRAEQCCRQYDRVQNFPGQVVEITLHPASIMREVTPLPLLIKDVEKAASFVRQGYKTILLMGGKAADVFLGYGDNVTRWRGHYEVLTSTVREWYDGVVARLRAKGPKVKRTKVPKKGKGSAIDAAVQGVDPLDTPSTEPPKFKRGKKRKDVTG